MSKFRKIGMTDRRMASHNLLASVQAEEKPAGNHHFIPFNIVLTIAKRAHITIEKN